MSKNNRKRNVTEQYNPSKANHEHVDILGVKEVHGAHNVRYTFDGDHLLTLFIDLFACRDGECIASSHNTSIEDLPVLLNLSVAAPSYTRKLLALAAEPGNEFKKIGTNTEWVVDKGVLKLFIDLSNAPLITKATLPGMQCTIASISPVHLLKKLNISLSFSLVCNGGVTWPMLSPQWNVAVEATEPIPFYDTVERALDFSTSSPTQRGEESPVPQPLLFELDKNVVLDIHAFPIVKLCLNVDGKAGRVIRFTGYILSGIGITLFVECFNEAQSPRRLAGETVEMNIKAYREGTPQSGEFLVVEFDSTCEGTVMPDGKRRRISSASSLIVENRFLVKFGATGPVVTPPTFAEVYATVCKYLDAKPNGLATLDMPAVRTHVSNVFPQHGVSRELRELVWEAVRLYVVNDYIPHEKYSASLSPTYFSIKQN